MIEEHQERLIAEKEAATLTGYSVSAFKKWRTAGDDGPAYVKLGRDVRYSMAELMAWLEVRKTRSGGVSRLNDAPELGETFGKVRVTKAGKAHYRVRL